MCGGRVVAGALKRRKLGGCRSAGCGLRAEFGWRAALAVERRRGETFCVKIVDRSTRGIQAHLTNRSSGTA
jgi:hypothetical protein